MKIAFLDRLRALFHGDSWDAFYFNSTLLIFDVIALGVFIFQTFGDDVLTSMYAVELVLAFIFAVEWVARLIVSPHRWRYLAHPLTIVDVFVIASLVVPALAAEFAFLRVLRWLRVVRILRQFSILSGRAEWAERQRAMIANLFQIGVFVCVTAAVVYLQQFGINQNINNYLDALYFTVTALTTTGFGEITPVGTVGRVLTMIIMIAGLTLFVQLVDTMFRPTRKQKTCPECGVRDHEIDAAHCRVCGTALHRPRD